MKLPAFTVDCIPPNIVPVKITGVPTISSEESSTVILSLEAVVSFADVVVNVNVLSNQTYPPPLYDDTTVTGSLTYVMIELYVLKYNAICVAFITFA